MLQPRPRRRRRPIVAVGVALLVAGLAALIAWPVLAAQARGAVTVFADGRPFLCRSGSVAVTGQEGDPQDPGDRYSTVLQVASGLDCDLRFVVENDSPVPVRIRAVVLPFLGPGSSLPVRATALDGGFFLVGAHAVDDGRDVRFAVLGSGMTLPAGDSVVLFARVGLKGTGCLQRGASFTAGDSPTVTVTALGLDGDRTPAYPAWSFGGTGRASCPGR